MPTYQLIRHEGLLSARAARPAPPPQPYTSVNVRLRLRGLPCNISWQELPVPILRLLQAYLQAQMRVGVSGVLVFRPDALTRISPTPLKPRVDCKLSHVISSLFVHDPEEAP